MREKLEKYDELHTKNIRLGSTNETLTETAENAALLKEKVGQMEGDRKRMEARCQKTHEVSAGHILQKTDNGGIYMSESDFSLEIGELRRWGGARALTGK